MAEIVKGFDSRYTTTIPENTEYKFAGIKITEAVGGGPYSQPLIQWKLAEERGLDRLPFHFWRGANAQDPVEHGIEQAEHFYETYISHFGNAELPPCIDCEDVYATKGLRSLNDIISCLERTEELWGKEPLIYSAGWWWDSWIKPYSVSFHPIYDYPLWEADPPPDTPIGYWDKSVIIQIKLDFAKPGFNASVDEDEADLTWYLSQLGTTPTLKAQLVEVLEMYENASDELEAIINQM
jgi:hypothetical protein